MLSKDGVGFDAIWCVRAGAPPTVFAGVGKGPGYEYPQAVVGRTTAEPSLSVHPAHRGAAGDGRRKQTVGSEREILLMAYSVNKEGIAVTAVPLDSLASNHDGGGA